MITRKRYDVSKVLHYTPWAVKTGHFIFQHNSRISWWIFTLFVPMETRMNILLNEYKIYKFTVSVSSIVAMVSAVRNDHGRQFLGCVRSNSLCANFAERLPMFVFSIFVRVFLDESPGRNFFLDSCRFWSKFYL